MKLTEQTPRVKKKAEAEHKATTVREMPLSMRCGAVGDVMPLANFLTPH